MTKIIPLLILFSFMCTAQTTERHIYKTVNNQNLKLIVLYKPSKTLRPAVIYFHGGAWYKGSKEYIFNKRVYTTVKKLVSVGFVIVAPSYRLSPGAVFPAAVKDCKDSIRWVYKKSKHYNIDTNNIHTWGRSAGGHLALMSGLSSNNTFIGDADLKIFPSKIRSIVSWFAPTDFVAAINIPGEKKRQIWMVKNFMGDYYKNIPKKYRQASPINYIRKNSPDILIFHGTKDPLVPISQSYRLKKAAKSVGKKITLKILEGEVHGFKGAKLQYAQQETFLFFTKKKK